MLLPHEKHLLIFHQHLVHIINNLKKLIQYYYKFYNVPKNAEALLKFKYGDDWKIPRENWNVVIDDKSISRQEDQS